MSTSLRPWSKAVSALCHPALVPWLTLLVAVPTSQTRGIAVLASAFVLTVVFPMGAAIVYFRKKNVENLFSISREIRLIPFLYFFLGVGMLYVLSILMNDSSISDQWFILVAVVSIAGFIVTFFYKISLHMMGMGACLAMVLEAGTGFPLLFTGLFIALALVVLAARYILKAHTMLELITGFALGLLATFAGFQLIA